MSSLENLDWRAEAGALIGDMKNHVHKIEISSRHKSNNMRIFFDIETLEQTKLVVSMDSSGFRICDMERSCNQTMSGGNNDVRQESPGPIPSQSPSATQERSTGGSGCEIKVYETINALLDDNSPKYRDAFAQALIDRMQSIENE